MQKINFYQQRVALNVLAKDVANAVDVYRAAEGHAVVGIISAQFNTVEEGVAEVKRWMEQVPAISVGLGAGSAQQFYKAAMIAAQTAPAHVNQTFTGSGFAAGALAARGVTNTRINALISPTGTAGSVIISTGVHSSQGLPAIVSCDTAVKMIQDLGGHAAKFFPMGGMQSLPELKALAESCVRNGMTMIEPTGGIDLNNFRPILETCLEAGVEQVMPHIYSSIIDADSGNTRIPDMVKLLEIVKSVMKSF